MDRTISVKGIGSISAKPDCVCLSLSITEKALEYEKAAENAARRIRLLQGAVRQAGFAAGDLKTAGFLVDTVYESASNQGGNYRRLFAGYSCVHRLKLEFALDSRRLAGVLAAIAGCGASPELNISFTVKDPDKAREELLASAAGNARAKAEALCRASGVRMGQLLRIDYGWDELDIVSPTLYRLEAGAVAPMAAADRTVPEIEPEDIRLRETARFVWKLSE